MRRTAWIGLVLTLAACAPKPPDKAPAGPATVATGTPEPARRLRFAIVPKQKDNPVFAYAKTAAEKRAAELGVEVLWDAPAQNDEAKQALVVETFAEQGVDGIAVSCSNPDTLGRAIDKAVAAGIPVVTWDSDSPNSQRKAFYGINDDATGRLLGEEMAALLPDGGSVALFSGVKGAENLEQRLRGAAEGLKVNPKIQVITTVYCDDDIAKSAQLVSDLVAGHPDLGGIIMVGGWPLFAANGLADIEPGKVKVVAVDPLPEAQHWIESGHVQVCVGQKVFGWGRESVNMLYALANGQPIAGADEHGFVDSGVDVVVKEKTGRYAGDRYIALADYRQLFAEMSGESAAPTGN